MKPDLSDIKPEHVKTVAVTLGFPVDKVDSAAPIDFEKFINSYLQGYINLGLEKAVDEDPEVVQLKTALNAKIQEKLSEVKPDSAAAAIVETK